MAQTKRARYVLSNSLVGCIVAIFGIVSVSGCAGTPPVPSKGGRVWLRLETEHFVLDTDQNPRLAEATIREFEHVLDGYFQLGWQAQGKLPLKLQAVVLDDRGEYERLFGVVGSGYFERAGVFDPLVVMSRTSSTENWVTLKKGLALHIAYQALPSAPAWLAAGLAKYFSYGYYTPGGDFVLGASRGWHSGFGSRTLVSALFTAEPVEAFSPLESIAWLLVHYLISERGAQFAHFQGALARGTSPEASWAEAFADLPVSQLDDTLMRYIQRGHYVSYAQHVPVRTVQPTLRKLSDADVYALRARLELACEDCSQERQRSADRNLQSALADEPTQLEAFALRELKRDGHAPIDDVRAVQRAHPDAWLPWLLVARAQLTQTSAMPQCDAATPAQLATLAPHQPYALMYAALCQISLGQRADALALSERALRGGPTSTALLALRARVLFAVGACDELDALRPRLQRAESDVLHELGTCGGEKPGLARLH